MGRRRDKALVVTRYLTSHTGIPLLRWNGYSIDAPAPYTIGVTTNALWERFGSQVKETNDIPGIPFVIRYDGYVDGVENALVGTSLKAFTELLTAHYEKGNN